MPHEEKYQQKLQEIVKRNALPTEWKLWLDIFIYSFIISVVVFLYHYITADKYSTRLVNRTAADVSMILIGLSFALSGLCYFWNFADHLIIYRKHLGLAGFAFALGHSIWSLLVLPLFGYYLQNENIVPFINAVLALIILTIMAIISNRYAIHQLGGQLWRNLLRVGYLAYIFAIIHFGMKGWPWWSKWFMEGDSLFPPFGLIVFLFSLSILGLRIAVWISTSRKPKEIHL